MQEQAVRSLATGFGHEDVLILSDWNRSGRGTARRPGYGQLLDMVRRDEVDALYSYSLSRLSRSLKDFTALVELCVSKGVSIRFAADSNLNVEVGGDKRRSATATLLLNVMASFSQFDSDVSSERARDAVAVRRARGDRIGHPNYGGLPGESEEAVVEAFREAGSILGAAKLLNARGVPTRMGRPWTHTPVRDILLRAGVLPYRSRPGVKAAAPFILYRLLTCHCGRTMTGSRYRNGPNPVYTVYRCLGGQPIPDHGRGTITEKALLSRVRDEARRLRPIPLVEVHGNEDRRRALGARRDRVVDMYAEGIVDKADRDRRLGAIADDMERLDAETRLLDVPTEVDWDAPPETINAVLRAMFDRIELGDDLTPTRFAWRVPEWRADDPVS